jgi:phenylpropionate dioxygenase-like ring-hydroxylating dioxygenase large terminal subunit
MNGTNGHVNVRPRGDDPMAPPPPGVMDIRTLIPLTGLKEYWYPVVAASDVKKKPVLLKRLGVDLVAFRGKTGEVVIFHNACPHRGAFLSEGSCTFKGFLTCFYHGYTFDEHGECVAVLGEGPESPMVGKVQTRVYPTVTYKGVVFAWMGDGEPAPLAESIPEEFPRSSSTRTPSC